MTKLTIGVGHTCIPGDINVDVSPQADISLDLNQGTLLFEDSGIGLIFSHHTLPGASGRSTPSPSPRSIFEWFKRFDKIIVTGPQRSGTRICAKMIAHDTGHQYIDENDIGPDSLYRLWSLHHKGDRVVIQAPTLCRHVHMFSADDTAIILMQRNVQDIIASQERIGWKWDKVELARYDRLDGVISEVKYQFWEEHQKAHIQHAFEIKYESLARHPLWVAKELRQGFGSGQTMRQDNSMTKPEARPYPCSNVLYLDHLDPTMALLVKGGTTKLINATGQLIWSLCDRARTYQDILQVLKTHFDDIEEDMLRRDLDEFIAHLVELGLLELD